MARSLKELAQDALAVQDACNLSGVARSFALAMSDLCHHVHNTDDRNTHPIARVWIDKMAQLAGINTDWAGQSMSKAYDEVHKLADRF